MSRAPLLVSAVLLAGAVLTGCGGSGDTGGSSATATATPGADGTPTIDITVKDGTITPQGKKVEVKAGAKLTFHVTADSKGEVHVHSSPEHEFEYAPGTTNETITLDQPGVVDVESHTLDKLIVQLEVR